jgi:hypothetical protein
MLAQCDSRTGKWNVLSIPVRRGRSERKCCGLEVLIIRKRPVSRRNRAVVEHKEREKDETSEWHRLCDVVWERKDRWKGRVGKAMLVVVIVVVARKACKEK